jgi:hypothetical protein
MKKHMAMIASFFGEGILALYGIQGRPPPFKLILE